MINISIKEFKIDDVVENAAIVNQLVEIVRPLYQNPEVILDQELRSNNRIFAATIDGRAIRGFFMVSDATFHAGLMRRGAYLGLSSVEQASHGLGIGRQLYMRFLQEFCEDSSWLDTDFIWFYSASPVAVRAWWNLVPSLLPNSRGDFDDATLEILSALAIRMKWTEYHGEYSWHLKGIAKARYSDAESARMRPLQSGIDIFSRGILNEREGDRFVFIATREAVRRDLGYCRQEDNVEPVTETATKRTR